ATVAIAAPASSSLAKVGSTGGARRPLILPVPPARIAGQRSRKKMVSWTLALHLTLKATLEGIFQHLNEVIDFYYSQVSILFGLYRVSTVHADGVGRRRSEAVQMAGILYCF
uniref:Uncharacterized protein n=1 Tax=Aegilops tauschii subsp. strangulata TaxID=200361 RepID=A0A453T5Q6_AEGTS